MSRLVGSISSVPTCPDGAPRSTTPVSANPLSPEDLGEPAIAALRAAARRDGSGMIRALGAQQHHAPAVALRGGVGADRGTGLDDGGLRGPRALHRRAAAGAGEGGADRHRAAARVARRTDRRPRGHPHRVARRDLDLAAARARRHALGRDGALDMTEPPTPFSATVPV